MQGGNLGRKDFWRKMFKSQSAASDTSSQSEQDTSECTTAHSGNTSDRRARSRSRRISLRKKLKLPIGKSMSVFIYGFAYYHAIKSMSNWDWAWHAWGWVGWWTEEKSFQVASPRLTSFHYFMHAYAKCRYFPNIHRMHLLCAKYTTLGVAEFEQEPLSTKDPHKTQGSCRLWISWRENTKYMKADTNKAWPIQSKNEKSPRLMCKTHSLGGAGRNRFRKKMADSLSQKSKPDHVHVRWHFTMSLTRPSVRESRTMQADKPYKRQ